MKSKIRSIYTVFSLVMFLTACISALGQASFTAPDTIKYLFKDTGFSTLHDFLAVKNQTGDSLNMRWKQHRVRYPSGWTTTLQDPTQWHNPVDGVDSADFVLPDSVSAPFNNKLVIGVDHNQQPGQGVVIFTVYEIGHPEDSVRLYFDVQVTPKIGLGENNLQELRIYPNPACDVVFLEAAHFSSGTRFAWTNSAGQNFRVSHQLTVEGKHEFNVSLLPSGMYILSILDKGELYHQKVYLQ